MMDAGLISLILIQQIAHGVQRFGVEKKCISMKMEIIL